MVQLFILYFGLPQLGIQLEPFEAGILGLALNTGAYCTELVHAPAYRQSTRADGAARSLGMSKSISMIRIIGPQASKIMIPPLVNQFITTIKNSSMVSLITIAELFRTGETIITTTFRSFEGIYGYRRYLFSH